jgi:hypothetical protein
VETEDRIRETQSSRAVAVPHACQPLKEVPHDRAHSRALNPAQEDPWMSETEGKFKGIRGFLWLAVGFILLALALGSLIYLVVHLTD